MYHGTGKYAFVSTYTYIYRAIHLSVLWSIQSIPRYTATVSAHPPDQAIFQRSSFLLLHHRLIDTVRSEICHMPLQIPRARTCPPASPSKDHAVPPDLQSTLTNTPLCLSTRTDLPDRPFVSPKTSAVSCWPYWIVSYDLVGAGWYVRVLWRPGKSVCACTSLRMLIEVESILTTQPVSMPLLNGRMSRPRPAAESAN